MKFVSILKVSCLSLATMVFAHNANAFTFTPFISGASMSAAVGGTSPIGLAYAGDRFVGSANYPYGNQLYQSDLNGGNVQMFGAGLTGFSGEIFVASSLSSGAYGSNEIYAGAESNGSIVRIAHDGSSQSVFTSGLTGGVRSIAFDPYGLYGNQMVVATNSGRIYTVNGSGVATQLAYFGEDAEGLAFSNTSFGGYAQGTLFVASEGSGAIRAVNPNGTFTTVFSVGGAETVHFVPLNIGQSGNPVEGFYGVNYPYDIQKISANQFIPYAGQAIVTSESSHGIYAINTNFAISHIGTFSAQPEDSIFVTADAIQQHGVPDGGITAAMLGSAFLGLAALRRRMSRA
jgi:VPDSG-CTERM motif